MEGARCAALIAACHCDVVRLLIVEDKVKMASLLRRALRSQGFAADVAIRGEDALWMAGSTRYDAIVLDVAHRGLRRAPSRADVGELPLRSVRGLRSG